jgi:tryptophan synthase
LYLFGILDVVQDTPVLVTFVTAGFPRNEDTVPILLAMQAGGTDIIELGIPFSDPIADGPVIQETNTVCLQEQILLRISHFKINRSH